MKFFTSMKTIALVAIGMIALVGFASATITQTASGYQTGNGNVQYVINSNAGAQNVVQVATGVQTGNNNYQSVFVYNAVVTPYTVKQVVSSVQTNNNNQQTIGAINYRYTAPVSQTISVLAYGSSQQNIVYVQPNVGSQYQLVIV